VDLHQRTSKPRLRKAERAPYARRVVGRRQAARCRSRRHGPRRHDLDPVHAGRRSRDDHEAVRCNWKGPRRRSCRSRDGFPKWLFDASKISVSRQQSGSER
jgi:hypothetical protein